MAEVAFPQGGDGDGLEAGDGANGPGGFEGAGEVTGVDGRDVFFLQGEGGLSGLPAAGVVELDIELALDPGVYVPGGFAMPYGDDAGGLHVLVFLQVVGLRPDFDSK